MEKTAIPDKIREALSGLLTIPVLHPSVSQQLIQNP